MGVDAIFRCNLTQFRINYEWSRESQLDQQFVMLIDKSVGFLLEWTTQINY